MLFHIVNPKDDSEFEEMIEAVKQLYYPEDILQKNYLKEMQKISLPDDATLNDINKLLKPTKEAFKQVVKSLSLRKNYEIFVGSIPFWLICFFGWTVKSSSYSLMRYAFFKMGCFLFVNDCPRNENMCFPFLDRFYGFFLERHWNLPEENPKKSNIDNRSDCFRLYPPPHLVEHPILGRPSVQTYPNFSRNYREYNHFINVVAATSRLINYFNKKSNVKSLFLEGEIQSLGEEVVNENYENFAQKLAYNEDEDEGFPNMRTFKLMLACFYHDIGKTVIDARHGIEGAIILGFHTSKACQQLNQITKKYAPDYEFERDDLLFIAELIKFHDIYGTLSTGEDSYLQLVEFLDTMKRYSSNYVNTKDGIDKEKQIKWSQRNVFDLWLLNVADIMVSLDDKFKLQNGRSEKFKGTDKINWMDKNDAKVYIEKFFKIPDALAWMYLLNEVVKSDLYSFMEYVFCKVGCFPEDRNLREKGDLLIHDLKISLELLEEHNKKQHTDDTSNLKELALNYAKRHAVERIRRLIKASLLKSLNKFYKIENIEEIIEEINSEIQNKRKGKKVIKKDDKLNEKIDTITTILNEIKNRKDIQWDSTIVSTIRANGDLQQFCGKLALIGKMDYSLGFFRKIAEGIFQNVAKAILEDRPCPGWFKDTDIQEYMDKSQMDKDQEKQKAEKYLRHIQAQFIADNYVAIIVQILEHLLFRDPSSEYFKNLEFRDASERLTEEKIDKIIDLEGPFRSKKSAQLILQTISMF